MDKKQIQLGMNPSTANGRLVKDLLFNFVTQAGHVCFRCSEPMTRETFSIEHTTPWLDSEDPIGLFFDMKNIAYSHLSCNIGARRTTSRPLRGYKHGTSAYRYGCRCETCKTVYSEARAERYKRLSS